MRDKRNGMERLKAGGQCDRKFPRSERPWGMLVYKEITSTVAIRGVVKDENFKEMIGVFEV